MDDDSEAEDQENDTPNARAPPSTAKKGKGRKGGRKGGKAKGQEEDSDIDLSGDEIADLNVDDLLASDDEAAPSAKGRKSKSRSTGRRRGVAAR